MDNISVELKKYENPDISKFSDRWRQNLLLIFQGINLYAETQEEYTDMCNEVLRATHDYDEMLAFPDNFELLCLKMKLPKHLFTNSCKVEKVIRHLNTIEHDERKSPMVREEAANQKKYWIAIDKADTFVTKNILCRSYTGAKYNKEVSNW